MYPPKLFLAPAEVSEPFECLKVSQLKSIHKLHYSTEIDLEMSRSRQSESESDPVTLMSLSAKVQARHRPVAGRSS